jgi:hypothetical protein
MARLARDPLEPRTYGGIGSKIELAVRSAVCVTIVVFLSFRHFSPFNVALYLGVCHEPTTI